MSGLWRLSRVVGLSLAVCLLLFVSSAAAMTISPTVAPSISGTAQVDVMLTAGPGSWPDSPSFSYRWLDCDPSDPTSCVAIAGATTNTYTVGPADGGSELEVRVSANDGIGDSGVANSAPTAVVTAQPGAPVVQSDPTIGPVTGGVQAVATAGTWSPTPDSVTTQWLSCAPDLSGCSPVGSADSTTYTPTVSDIGNVLVFVVFTTRSGLDSVLATSSPSAVVAFPLPTVNIVSPTPGEQVLVPRAVIAEYSCTPPAGMTLRSCSGPVQDGLGYTVSTAGSQSFTVTATDSDGQTASDTVNFTGTTLSLPTPRPPTVTVISPVPGASYTQGTPLSLSFICSAEDCSATQAPSPSSYAVYAGGGSIDGAAVGGPLETATLGTHTITIIAQQIFPPVQKATTTLTYAVVPGPALSITDLTQSSHRWHPGKALPAPTPPGGKAARNGTKFSYTSNYPVSMTFTITRELPGRKHGTRCTAPTRANRHHKACIRRTPQGSFTIPGIDGANQVYFQGPLNSRDKLPPGRYTATATAHTTGSTAPAGGPASITVGTLDFTIIK